MSIDFGHWANRNKGMLGANAMKRVAAGATKNRQNSLYSVILNEFRYIFYIRSSLYLHTHSLWTGYSEIVGLFYGTFSKRIHAWERRSGHLVIASVIWSGTEALNSVWWSESRYTIADTTNSLWTGESMSRAEFPLLRIVTQNREASIWAKVLIITENKRPDAFLQWDRTSIRFYSVSVFWCMNDFIQSGSLV